MTLTLETLRVDTSNTPHFPLMEQIVEYINAKTQNPHKEFFRIMVAYYLGKIAGSMRATIITKDRGNIPVNTYAIALATSGYSKGHSVGLLENLSEGFREVFADETLPIVAEANLIKISSVRAANKGTTENEEYEAIRKEYDSAGEVPFTFDSGTVPAIKQLRHKLLLASLGSINLQIDEISLNLLGSIEPLTAYLELFDMGKLNSKLTKNTKDSVRGKELVGKTPANLLLFGTPTKVFDGSIVESQFNDMLEMGYARRCLFAFANTPVKVFTKTPKQVFDELTNTATQASEIHIKNLFRQLADNRLHDWEIGLPDDSAILLIQYKMYCEQLASTYPDHKAVESAELSHRYFKALKLAGAFAFSNLDQEISTLTLMQAIKLVEESGESFEKIRTREKAYVRLAKYISSTGVEMTQAELVEQLPFFKGSNATRSEMLQLASSWGFTNHIVITKRTLNGIELFSGERLKETNPDKLIISYSNELAHNYEPELCRFDQLSVLASTPDLHWCNHTFKDGHRLEANAIPEFNLVVIDIDGGFNAQAAHSLLSEYRHVIYTTKRSTPENNRFRIIMPISHTLKLNSDDYRQLMINILDWLPIPADTEANQRSRKWLSNPSGTILVNDSGALLDVLKFIPRTNKEQTKPSLLDATKMETWFLEQVDNLGRNNTLLRYGLVLFDSGMGLLEVTNTVTTLNSKFTNPLLQSELEATIFKTIANKYV